MMEKKWLIVITLGVIFIPFTTGFSLSRLKKPSWTDIYTKKAPIARGWKYIIVHHSGTDSGNAASFHRYHTDMGYGGLSYHFVIGNGNGSEDGKIETGFRWEQQISGTHVDIHSWYHNIFGIGICLVGNFEKSMPTQRQIESLNRLIKDLTGQYNIPSRNIIGHNQVPHSTLTWDAHAIKFKPVKGKKARTACPGLHMSGILNGLDIR